MIAGRDRAAVADAPGEGRGVGDENGVRGEAAPTEIVPLLVTPPAELLTNWVTPLTTMPAPAVMLPLLLISPAKITMSPTKIPSPLAEIVPPLLTPPVKFETSSTSMLRAPAEIMPLLAMPPEKIERH